MPRQWSPSEQAGEGSTGEHRRADRRATPTSELGRRAGGLRARQRAAAARRPHPAPGQRGRAERARLDADLQGRDRRRHRDAARRSTSTAPPTRSIHDAIIDLYGRGEPADPVTVAAELQRRGELQRVGGAPYLHTLSANVPIAANAGYYAEIVREKAILRRLVDAGTKIVADRLRRRGRRSTTSSTRRRPRSTRSPTAARPRTTRRCATSWSGVLDEIEAIGNREAGLYGVPTGFADLDDLTNGLHSGQMIIVAARPAMGKSTLALDFCRAASIHNNLTSCFFSLEMTRSEIMMRLLSAEAKVPLNHIRNGK